MNRYVYQPNQFRNQPSLTHQVPNLNQFATDPNDERFIGLLPFVGGLALGGLLWNGGYGGCGGRPCGGYPYPYPSYPAYQPMYYPQPSYPYQQTFSYPQTNAPYQPYTQNSSTVLESNKYYLS